MAVDEDGAAGLVTAVAGDDDGREGEVRFPRLGAQRPGLDVAV